MSAKRTSATCLLLLLIAFAAALPAAAGHPHGERYYCTQHGPFFIRFDGQKLAGVFALLANGDLGSMVGTLDGDEMTGRWQEVGASGDIVIHFTPDRGAFVAEYRVDGAPEKWHGNWRGVLRYADGDSAFTLGETDYRCE